MTQRKYVNLILAVSALLVATAADLLGGSPYRRGTAAASQLLIPVGGPGIALSGASLASVRGLDALQWNPAGLSGSTSSFEVMFSHLSYIADIGVDYVALAGNLGELGSLGLSLKMLSIGSIDITTVDQPEGTGFSYSPTYLVAGVSYSRVMTDRILFGVTFKLIHEKVHLVEGNALAFDFGLQYRAGETGFRFGIVLKNLGSKLSFDGPGFEYTLTNPDNPPGTGPNTYRLTSAAYDLPTMLEGGVGYDLLFPGANMVSLTATFANNNYSNDEYRIGAEYSYDNTLFLRGGHTFVPDIPGEFEYTYGPTFGGGIHYQLGGVLVAFDYTYRVTKFFQANQWFTVRLGF